MSRITPLAKPFTVIVEGYGLAGPCSPDPGTAIGVVLVKRNVCRRRRGVADDRCCLRFLCFLCFLAAASLASARGAAARTRLPREASRPRRDDDDGTVLITDSQCCVSTVSLLAPLRLVGPNAPRRHTTVGRSGSNGCQLRNR